MNPEKWNRSRQRTYFESLVNQFGDKLNNTGGNPPMELVDDYMTNDNLLRSNIVRFTLAVAVVAQLELLTKLIAEGDLLDGPRRDASHG